MMSNIQDVESIVNPQKYMKPMTSAMVNMTEMSTKTAPVTLANMKITMKNTQVRARAMLRINSSLG